MLKEEQAGIFMKTCENCGEVLPQGRRRFCSNECSNNHYNIRRRVVFERSGTCDFCGKHFEKKTKTHRFCNPSCKSEYESINKRKTSLLSECLQCGKEFQRSNYYERYCPECKANPDPIQERATKLKRRAQEQEIARKLDVEAQRQEFLKALCAAHEPVKDWKPRQVITLKTKPQFPEEVANIVLSDWHLGEVVRKEETGGLCEFNMEIAQKRIEKLLESQKEIILIHTRGGIPIKKCVVWLLGDIITGETIYKGQKNFIEFGIAEQIVNAKQTLGEFLLNLLTLYSNVKVVAVMGNHGRVGVRGEATVIWNNYDWVVYNWTKDLLSNYAQIEWNISQAWFIIEEIEGWRFIGQHGEDIRQWLRTPWYGIERDIAEMTEILSDIEEKPPYYWLYAHFHVAEQAETPRGERIINGSLVGGNLFSVKKLRKVSRPSQSFFGVSRKQGITWRYNIYLD